MLNKENNKGCGKRIVEKKGGLKLSYICRTEDIGVAEVNHLCSKCKKKEEEKIDGNKAFEPILEEMK